MSGKSYTMKEMKAIVEYLTEHKAYGEIKGRKMWKDMANSKITNRTWQSLKETFLKRILPDLHNPYYKLSLHQISSFRQGHDVEARLNNKLKIKPASQDSNTEDEEKTEVQPDNSNDKNEDKTAGEGPKPSESDIRASTETLVLEDCYENTEEKDQTQTKSLRDLITYSEPLTPMLQAVIDDFATDEDDGSNDEPRMQIVEQPETGLNNDEEGKGANKVPVEESAPEETQENPNEELIDKTINKSPSHDKTDVPPSRTDNENGKSVDLLIVLSESEENTKVDNEGKTPSNIAEENKPKTSCEMTQNSNTTNDTLIPDNQEALKGNSQRISDSGKQLTENNQNSKRSKKRANSDENTCAPISKKRFDKDKQSISDTDTCVKNKNKTSDKFNQITFKENIPEAAVEPSANVNSENDLPINDLPENNQQDTNTENLQPNHNDSEELENPCLKSVSLYAEQFSNSKYTDSETSNVEDGNKKEDNKKKEDNSKTKKKIEVATATTIATTAAATKQDKDKEDIIKKQVVVNTVKTDVINEVVILKSHSESDSDSNKEEPKKGPELAAKQQRDKALANMFGFSSGRVSKSRKSGNSYRKQSSSRNRTLIASSGSSEWTSDTGSEYVSPPRGRKNRRTRKYLKPKSARILSLEEEGGLFVMYGKKIYPVVKDGKVIKNYVTYTPDKDFEQEESFWKLKYVEEKKKTAELTKLLNEVKGKNEQDDVSRVPVLPTTSRNQIPEEIPKKTTDIVSENKMPIKEPEQKIQPVEEKVKIKFTKNNEEVQLEGHWSHVNPVLTQVLQLLQRGPELTAKETKPQIKSDPEPKEFSRKLTPELEMVVDEEVQEKVNQLESEIFKEIEDREKEKSSTPKQKTPEPEKNVTKRRGRAQKSQPSAPTEQSPSKKPKLEEPKNKPDQEDTSSTVQTVTVATRRTTRTPKKPTTDKTDVAESDTVKTRQTAKKSNQTTKKDSKTEDDEVRYKLRSPPSTRQSHSNKSNNVTKATRQRKSSSSANFRIYSSPENLSLHSVESTQGYQDSDGSPFPTHLRKKKITLTFPSHRTKTQARYRKKSHPYFTDDVTSESSNSLQGPPIETMTFQNSTLKSDIYKTESYQLLMNKNVTLRNKSSSQLEKIEEASPMSKELQYISDQICKEISDLEIEKDTQEKENLAPLNTDSSSNVTLPTSPVLSIVENISINKSFLNNSNEFDFEDKLLSNDPVKHIMLNELMKTGGDISMPLMEHECGIETCDQNGVEYHYNLNIPKTSTAVSESFLSKINTVNIEDPTLSETIQGKLKNLILESTKKNQKSNCNVTVDNNPKEKNMAKVTKSKKRSSTPRKRQSTRKLKLTNAEPCIEEEHMETFSYTGRKSCPPLIQIFEDLNPTNDYKSIQNTESNTDKPKGRKKKDVIKVKISKPKSKNLDKETVESSNQTIQKSIQTDSGINDTESSVFLQAFNDSVDLIHNHSETCLNANECLGDSIEIIENATKSIISLNSNSDHLDVDICHEIFGNVPNDLAQELFTSDAQDISVLQKVIGMSDYKTAESADATTYHTLGSLSPPDSLITEDLSNEIPEKTARNTKWYLFSEDEASNTVLDINQNSTSLGYGANLNQIFPITCAVPDLSTITEMSKDENSRKFSNDSHTRNDLDSQSVQ